MTYPTDNVESINEDDYDADTVLQSIPVHITGKTEEQSDAASLASWQTLSLNPGQYRQILPQDVKRKKAIILVPLYGGDNIVYIGSRKAMQSGGLPDASDFLADGLAFSGIALGGANGNAGINSIPYEAHAEVWAYSPPDLDGPTVICVLDQRYLR